MMFTLSYDTEAVRLAVAPQRRGLLAALFSRKQQRDLKMLEPVDRDLLLTLADLRALADESGDALTIGADHILLSHRLAARLPTAVASVLGLPPLVHLTLTTDAEGNVGASNFRLRTAWARHGIRQNPQRVGSLLETSDGLRRLPLWMTDALDVAEAQPKPGSVIDDWAALARFRQALDPGVRVGDPDQAARASMTDFLTKLQVRVADRLSLAVNESADDFEVLPFSGSKIDVLAEGAVGENDCEISGDELKIFQSRLRQRGALPAFRIGEGSFLVIDRSALPALGVMADMQQASTGERRGFIRNPRPRITEAVEAVLRQRGELDGLSDEAKEEAVEAKAGPLFVETKEFSERVTGIAQFERPEFGGFDSSGTTWMPEQFAQRVAELLSGMSTRQLEDKRAEVAQAIQSGAKSVSIGDVDLPACPQALATIEAHLDRRRQESPLDETPTEAVTSEALVLVPKSNLKELLWTPPNRPRVTLAPAVVPAQIRTPLKEHQIDSLQWQIAAWKTGLPGILNADEQGLGKTLQTIAFLVWLKSHMAEETAAQRGPILVVAPTSLLENWREEVERHVNKHAFGHLIPLYGGATATRRIAGQVGHDTETGEAKLDLDILHEAVAEGRAHRFWVLTTYTTLTNYQHSLAPIPFSALVFDEIQNLKNPTSQRAQAALCMKADFRIGLTGTPIENSADDLWAVMEQLAPGRLDSLREFRRVYAAPEAANMKALHSKVFGSVDGPPLALRRTKDQVARDLPPKQRYLHPRAMPPAQASVYDEARLKLAQGGLGAALKMLHHIRSVSVHPALDARAADGDFIAASGRLSATFDILRRIKAKGERALVFIEHRQMQYRFIELARAEFGLIRIDLINGETPIPQRQAIVTRFQNHLERPGSFDILVLGPKAAGVGLTLTAATHVIHLSRWWNPAVEEQCNDRVHRIGQTKPVAVHVPLAIHPDYREQSFDCLLHSLMQKKRKLAASALWPMGDTERDAAELRNMVAAEKSGGAGDAVDTTLAAMFARDGMALPPRQQDGSVCYL